MVRTTSLRALGGGGLVLGLSALGAAACGSLNTDDLFVGNTASGAGGAAATGSTHASSGAGMGGQTSSVSGASSGTGGTPVTCGNGHKDPGEACDGSDLGGASCADKGFSTPAGTTCKANCQLDYGGCTAACDGVKLEPGEICDGAFLGTHTCHELGYVAAGGLACKSCQLDPSGCKATCGNGKTEPNELCDGADVGTKTCHDFGFVAPGGLACKAGCQAYDASGCHATCGNNVLEPGEICDGTFLNGHDCTDFGYVNPVGVKCVACAVNASACKPVCGNNVVEPGEECDDGNTTSGDGCSSTCKTEITGGTTCATAVATMVPPGATTLAGSTVGGGSHTGAGCPGAGPDRIHVLTVQASGFLTVSLPRAQTSFNSVLYITKACSDAAPNPALLCADSYDAVNNLPLNGGEVVSIQVTQGQTYYVFVDGVKASDKGAYQLLVDLSSGTDCNDPVPIPLAPGTPMTVLGSNVGTVPATQGSCGGQPGGQIVYRITRPDDGMLGVATDPNATNYNSVLYARSTCNDGNTELACSNQGGTATESITVQGVLGGVPTFVWVDGSQIGGGSAFGGYGLVLTP